MVRDVRLADCRIKHSVGLSVRVHLRIVSVDPVAAVGQYVHIVSQLGDALAVSAAPSERASLRPHEADTDADLPSSKQTDIVKQCPTKLQ
jgi:hypothetical protein